MPLLSPRDLAVALTRRMSVTNSPGESEFGAFLEETLRVHFGDVWRQPTVDDSYPRDVVYALARHGNSRKTVLLTGHYDTVSLEPYGPMFEHLACDPEALAPALIAHLRRTGDDARALADLESGEFLAGRGLLDMKGGLAAGLTVLERPFDEGNLLFAAVPDEEVASHGMRSLMRQLPLICAEHGLDVVAAINLDSSGEPAVYFGSVGKSLPVAVFLGRPTHAGAPFDGVSAALPMAEFVRLVECNAALGDGVGGPAPPAVLYARDLRTHYDVTTPAAAFCAVNVLTHRRSAEEVLAAIRALATQALRNSLETLELRAGRKLPYAPVVLEVEELCAGSVEQTAAAMVELAARKGISGPAAIVGFAPPFYPVAEWRAQDHALRAVIESAIGDYQARAFFPGISDMSFLNPVGGSFAIPAVNIGPWGHDYHQRYERIHCRHAFEILPDLLWRVVRGILS